MLSRLLPMWVTRSAAANELARRPFSIGWKAANGDTPTRSWMKSVQEARLGSAMQPDGSPHQEAEAAALQAGIGLLDLHQRQRLAWLHGRPLTLAVTTTADGTGGKPA
jgi:hypothetical protein